MEYTDEHWMRQAIKLSKEALARKEVPVGAVVVFRDSVIGKGYNQVELLKDATAHAEMIAITSAANHLGDWRLKDATLYVTKEPCLMCAGAIINSRVSRVVYSIRDEKEGAGGTRYDVMRDHRKGFIEVVSEVLKEESFVVYQQFFQGIRIKEPF